MHKCKMHKCIFQLNGGPVSLTMEEIKKAYPDTNSLLGTSVYVKASVMSSSGGKIIKKNNFNVPLLWVMKSSYFGFGSTQQQVDMHARSQNTFIVL